MTDFLSKEPAHVSGHNRSCYTTSNLLCLVTQRILLHPLPSFPSRRSSSSLGNVLHYPKEFMFITCLQLNRMDMASQRDKTILVNRCWKPSGMFSVALGPTPPHGACLSPLPVYTQGSAVFISKRIHRPGANALLQ